MVPASETEEWDLVQMTTTAHPKPPLPFTLRIALRYSPGASVAPYTSMAPTSSGRNVVVNVADCLFQVWNPIDHVTHAVPAPLRGCNDGKAVSSVGHADAGNSDQYVVKRFRLFPRYIRRRHVEPDSGESPAIETDPHIPGLELSHDPDRVEHDNRLAQSYIDASGLTLADLDGCPHRFVADRPDDQTTSS